MTKLPRISAILIAIIGCVGSGVAAAQTSTAKSWPTRVVCIVLPSSPGAGSDIIGNSPEEFSAQIRDGREKWAKVARDAGIKPK